MSHFHQALACHTSGSHFHHALACHASGDGGGDGVECGDLLLDEEGQGVGAMYGPLDRLAVLAVMQQLQVGGVPGTGGHYCRWGGYLVLGGTTAGGGYQVLGGRTADGVVTGYWVAVLQMGWLPGTGGHYCRWGGYRVLGGRTAGGGYQVLGCRTAGVGGYRVLGCRTAGACVPPPRPPQVGRPQAVALLQQAGGDPVEAVRQNMHLLPR